MRRLLDRLVKVEIIGQPECPMMLRWTLVDAGFAKAMVHYFPPNTTDTDPHDHPRPFVTFVVKGGYRDLHWEHPLLIPTEEWVGRGALRYRPARHMHLTETGDAGAWTFVVMGPVVRAWGFLRDLRWIPFREYVDRYGGTIRCESDEAER